MQATAEHPCKILPCYLRERPLGRDYMALALGEYGATWHTSLDAAQRAVRAHCIAYAKLHNGAEPESLVFYVNDDGRGYQVA